MMDELEHVLSEIESGPDIAVVVIRGEGKAFSAGVDVAAHTPDNVEQMLAKFHGVIRAMVATKKVTIAAVHGHCLGGGAELAMVCDIALYDGRCTVGISRDQAGVLSTGGLRGIGGADWPEAGV